MQFSHTEKLTVMSPDRTTCWPINWIALPVAPTIYYLIQKKSLLLPPLQVSRASSFTKRTDDWTSIKSNIDHIEHRTSNIDYIKHRIHRTSIEPNPTDRTTPDRSNPTDERTDESKNVKIRFCQDATWTLTWTLLDLSNSKNDDLYRIKSQPYPQPAFWLDPMVLYYIRHCQN